MCLTKKQEAECRRKSGWGEILLVSQENWVKRSVHTRHLVTMIYILVDDVLFCNVLEDKNRFFFLKDRNVYTVQQLKMDISNHLVQPAHFMGREIEA